MERTAGPDAAPGVPRRVWLVLLLVAAIGAAALWWTFQAPAGSGWFFLSTAVLTACWLVGGRESAALLPVPLRLVGRRRNAVGEVLIGVGTGLVLAALFVVGGLGLALFPDLQRSVSEVLAQRGHAPLALLAVTTALTGAAEEVFFRGALQPALLRAWRARTPHRDTAAVTWPPIVTSALLYGLVTAATGEPMLVFAAVLLGLVVGRQRQVTGGLAAPIVTHLIWSLSMLLVLPAVVGSS